MKYVSQYSLNDLAQMEKITEKAWQALVTNNPNDTVSYADLCTELAILLVNTSSTLDVPFNEITNDIVTAANKIEVLKNTLLRKALTGGDDECD